MIFQSLIFSLIPLIGNCQVKESVIEMDSNPMREYEAIVHTEYLKKESSLNLFLRRNEVVEKCSSLSTDDKYKQIAMSLVRDECDSHHRASEHVLNFMNLIIEWIMREQVVEDLSEKEAIHHVLYTDNYKKLIEIVLEDHIRNYQNSQGLISQTKLRMTEEFFMEISNEKIVLSEKFESCTLAELKEFCFTVKDWALITEINAISGVLRKN